MPYRIRVKGEFSGAHRVAGHEICSRLHGHNYKVEVFCIVDELDERGISFDFKILKDMLKEIIEKFDHRYLNEFEEIGNPTAENIAKYIFKRMKLPNNVKLEKVRVWETNNYWGEYYE